MYLRIYVGLNDAVILPRESLATAAGPTTAPPAEGSANNSDEMSQYIEAVLSLSI